MLAHADLAPTIMPFARSKGELASTSGTESITEVIMQPSAGLGTEPSTKPATKPVTKPATDLATDPATHPATEPATQAVTEPAVNVSPQNKQAMQIGSKQVDETQTEANEAIPEIVSLLEEIKSFEKAKKTLLEKEIKQKKIEGLKAIRSKVTARAEALTEVLKSWGNMEE